MLSANGSARDVAHDPGLYVTGIPPYDGTASAAGDDSDDSDDEGDVPYQTLILGPYVKDALNVRLKRISFERVFKLNSDPDLVVTKFTVGQDSIVPSIDELKAFVQRLPSVSNSDSAAVKDCKRNAKECLDILQARQRQLTNLRNRLNESVEAGSIAKRLLKNLFMFAMYARRWAGPDTPYPIVRRETNRNVGQHKPLSPALRGMTVHVGATGVVTLRADKGDGKGEAADTIMDGKAMAMMDAHLLGAFNTIDSIPDSGLRNFFTTNLLLANSARTTDDTRWPAEETVWQALFGAHSVSSGETCIRQISSTILHTCHMLTPIIYRTQPQWMRYEAVLDEIQ